MDMRDVRGHPGYRVSDDGNVWSDICRRWLHQYTDRVGRRTIHLRASSPGRETTHLVHRLVLEAFVGPCPEGMEACHNNGDPADNRLENLRWDTRSANAKDKVRHGRCPLSGDAVPRPKGVANGHAKLRELDVRWIRYLSGAGIGAKALADTYSVSSNMIRNIKFHRSWKHI
jgi:hypothetical protein